MKTGVWRAAGLFMIGVLVPACGISGDGTLNPTVAPAVPTGLTAIGAPLRASLSWNASPAAASYSVGRSLTAGGPYTLIPSGTGITATSFVDQGLTNGTAYYYVVSASNRFGVSANSAEVRVVPGFNVALISAGLLFDYPALQAHLSLAVLADGSLWGWGDNSYNQLGNATQNGLSNFALEMPVPFTSPIIALSTSGYHVLALTSDGDVWAWGDNQYGQLGDGQQTTAAPYGVGTPVKVPALSGITAIAAGANHSLALRSDGTIWAWGLNSSGQLGDGTTIDRLSPIQVPLPAGLTGVKSVSAGEFHSLALSTDGTVWMWGFNYYGDEGVADMMGSTPTQVPNLTTAVAISAGSNFDLALGSDGTVWAWGDNTWGELGNSTVTSASSALRVQVLGLPGISAISAGGLHSLALAADGTVWAWGSNQFGELGNGTTTIAPPYDSDVPVQVLTLEGISAISAGASHNLALRSDGSLWAWGSDGLGELGNGGGAVQPVAVDIPNLSAVKAASAGGLHSLALDVGGIVWSWGNNQYGQLGNGTEIDSINPVAVPGLGAMSAISAGGYHSLALSASGTVWSWGFNYSGELGNGTSTTTAPFGIPTPAQVINLTSVDVKAISAGDLHSLVLTSAGTVWSWGNNALGQIGNGTVSGSTPVATPAQVSALSGVFTAIAAGGAHSLVLRSDGTVWSWGEDDSGQLGYGIGNPNPTPAQVPLPAGIYTAIAAGGAHSLALRSDGTLWAWGSNVYGQLGNGSTTNSFSPVEVSLPPGLTGVTAIAAGNFHSLVLASGGTAWAWGFNGNGQLGQGTTTNSLVPVQVPSLTGVQSISSGAISNQALAVLSNQICGGWGSNANGQLALAPAGLSNVPLQVTH